MPPYSQDSTLAQQQPLAVAPKKPSSSTMITGRQVAQGVINLGNTCYMNAVLQALAHCQELNMAMDMEPHSASCPIRRRTSPSPDASRGTRKSARANGKKSPSPDSDDSASSFCALCEFEHHLRSVHSTSEPVAPSAFVNGFIDHVAPWFNLGVQEDSHEFLRLLIDAMQKSCTKARSSQKVDSEYPFQLFRGTVESNVQCESCLASSSTIDPIEDIGLDVSAKSANSPHGKVTPPPNALADVSKAFKRFKAEENLEGYKCEKCGKTGKATKQSRLASIPPILTLHLKRFRYGTSTEEQVAARRRSEISQLLARDASTTAGKSGSAKIEGHVKFEEIFNLTPFLTESLQKKRGSNMVRLFAVVVHAGANSHSGHYIAYVRNIEKNEWWKMDDARVTRASKEEVLSAEAYMLFYRAVQHPILQNIESRHKELAKEQVAVEPDASSLEAAVVDPTESTKASSDNKKRKREFLEFLNGEEWAVNKTSIAPHLLKRAEEWVADNVEFGPSFFQRIDEAARKDSGAPASLGEEDVQGGLDKFYPPLRELLFKIYEANPTNFFKPDKKDNDTKKSTLIAPPVADNDAFL